MFSLLDSTAADHADQWTTPAFARVYWNSAHEHRWRIYRPRNKHTCRRANWNHDKSPKDLTSDSTLPFYRPYPYPVTLQQYSYPTMYQYLDLGPTPQSSTYMYGCPLSHTPRASFLRLGEGVHIKVLVNSAVFKLVPAMASRADDSHFAGARGRWCFQLRPH